MDYHENNEENSESDGDERLAVSYAMYEGAGAGEEAADELGRRSPSDSESEEDDDEREQFDIALASTHSYMRSPVAGWGGGAGGEMVPVRSGSVVAAGWRGRVPLLARRGVLFPGDTLPLLLPHERDATRLRLALQHDRLFALLSLDEELNSLTGYGVLCEAYEAGAEAEGGAGPARCLARALHRCRLVHPPDRTAPTPRAAEVEVLGEAAPAGPVPRARPGVRSRRQRALEAATTPWPLFLYDMFDAGRVQQHIKEYFKPLGLEKRMPSEAVSLSWWAARNLSLSGAARRALFQCASAPLRLHMAAALAPRAPAVACAACGAELAKVSHVRAMSAHGPHAVYANPAGHSHDVVTTRRAAGVTPHGRPCADFSWFPGYAWTVLACSRCMQHVGWRFDAISKTLRPRRFFGLTRHYAAAARAAEPEELHLPFSLQFSLT